MSTAVDKLKHYLDFHQNPEGFLDALCLSASQSVRHDYGKERGANPVMSEAQRKAVKKLASRIKKKGIMSSHTKSSREDSGNGEEEEEGEDEAFDILSKDRVILFEGQVHKRSLHSMVSHSSSRHMILFNDVIVLFSTHGALLSSGHYYTIHRVIPLDEVAITPYLTDDLGIEDEDEPHGFILTTFGPKGRPFHIIAESESDKKIWCEEIESAILSYVSSTHETGGSNAGKILPPGWQHNAVRGNLMSAAMMGDVGELKYQLSRGAELGIHVEDVDDYGMNPLHWAVLSGQCVNVEALVQAGIDIESVNNSLNSSLLLAAAIGAADIFVFLVEQGADIFLRNMHDRDALFMCAMYCLEDRGMTVIVDLIVSQSVDVDQPDSAGATALHECCSSSLQHSIEVLIAAGADINKTHSRTGLTPLQICCSLEFPCVETVRAVLNHGAYPNPKTSQGLSAMDMILETFFSRHPTLPRERVLPSGGDQDVENDMGMDRYVEFAHQCLPSLMELAKYGGRLAGPHGMGGLRESLTDSVKSGEEQWIAKGVPERFTELVHCVKIGEGHPNWASDKIENCQLCADKFTFSNRRHHCRVSGALVCDACSTKRLPCSGSDSRGASESGKNGKRRAESASTPGPSHAEMIRVSDGVYNRLNYSCESREKDIAIQMKTKKQMQEVAQAAQKKREEDDNKFMKGNLFNWGSSSGSNTPTAKTPTGDKSTPGNTQGAIASMQAQNDETMRALQERGEKLEQLNVKAEDMNEAASEFQANAAKLLRQQQNRKWYE